MLTRHRLITQDHDSREKIQHDTRSHKFEHMPFRTVNTVNDSPSWIESSHSQWVHIRLAVITELVGKSVYRALYPFATSVSPPIFNRGQS